MKKNTIEVLMLLLGSIIYVIGINYFIVTANIYSAGLMGLAQETAQTINLIFNLGWTNTDSSYLLTQTIAYWTLNLPAIVLGFAMVGKRFTTKTLICSFIFIPLMMNLFIPAGSLLLDLHGELTLASQVLSVVAGGVLTGAGMGIIFKFGGSSGGTDIFATYLALFKGKSFGAYNLLINFIVIGWAVILYQDIEIAFLLLILIYVQSKTVDYVYNFHEKVTMFVVTTEGEAIGELVLRKKDRTYTHLEASLGYSKTKASLLLIVINQEEVHAAIDAIELLDSNCFIDVVKTTAISGNFVNRFKSQL